MEIFNAYVHMCILYNELLPCLLKDCCLSDGNVDPTHSLFLEVRKGEEVASLCMVSDACLLCKVFYACLFYNAIMQ